ncbi:MAG: hypothetical protein OXI43_20080 [Candidatus Poribacteria bacterium]|nr:hypothetical protein [Candidatus Poribacteria bacterium]
MATRSEILSQYAKLSAFRGLTTEDRGTYLDLALEAVETYAPKKVKLKKIPSQDDSRYDVPSNAKLLLGAFVVDTNIRIEMREENELRKVNDNGDYDEDADPVEMRVYQLLQVQVPSYIDLVRHEDLSGHQSYPTPYASGYRYGTFAGAGYGSHDLEYTVPIEVEDLSTRQLLALRLYAESEAYQYQATKSENLSDITDRDATGESTTLRRSQSGMAFQKLAERKEKEFRREIVRPYWAQPSYGLTEYLWKNHRI